MPPSSRRAGGQTPREYRLRDLIAALDTAKDDDRVKAVALDLDGFLGGGQAAMRRSAKRSTGCGVGQAGDRFCHRLYATTATSSPRTRRKSGCNPLGAVAIAGPGGNNLYFKGLLDKLGVTANIYRVGTYKAAVEPYTRNDMSPEARENAQALGDALLETWREDVASARPAARRDRRLSCAIRSATSAAADGDLAKAALGGKLVDKHRRARAFEARLAELGGKDEDTRMAATSGSSCDAYIGDRSTASPTGRSAS